MVHQGNSPVNELIEHSNIPLRSSQTQIHDLQAQNRVHRNSQNSSVADAVAAGGENLQLVDITDENDANNNQGMQNQQASDAFNPEGSSGGECKS